VKRLVSWFLHDGLVAAVLVWAGAVGLMAYDLTDAGRRWILAALSLGGVATIGGIVWIRAYVDGLQEASNRGTES